MDYSFDSETRMLDDSLVRFVSDNTGSKQDLWPQMAELGWLSLPFAEEAGGAGFGNIGSMVLMERFGAGLISTPYIPSIAMAGSALAQSGSQTERLAAVIEGRSRPAIAGLWGQDIAQFSARQSGDGPGNGPGNGPGDGAGDSAGGSFVLNGSATLIPGASDAKIDAVIVPAQISGSSEPALFLVTEGQQGVSFTAQTLFDGSTAQRLTLNDVAVPAAQLLTGQNQGQNQGSSALRAMWDAGLLAAAAENLGAMQTLFDLTLDYARTRNQFGRAIGSFQTIQFRLVDLWIKLDEARSLVMTATMATNDGHEDAHRLTIAGWIQTMWSARAISEEAIQIHGAIGMTQEFDVSRYVKRILLNQLVFGSAERHLQYYRSLAAA